MTRIAKLLPFASVALFALSFSPAANATTMIGTVDTFTLSVGGSCCSTDPNAFGTITLTQTGATTVSVLETLTSGIDFVGTGAGDSLGFNATGVTTSDITLTGSSVGKFTIHGSNADNPFGTFALNIECDNPTICHGGSTVYPGPLSFTISGADISDFVASTSSYGDIWFASDVIDYNINVNGSSPTGVVGAGAGKITPPATPEPSSLLLLGTGLLGSGLMIRRRVAA